MQSEGVALRKMVVSKQTTRKGRKLRRKMTKAMAVLKVSYVP